jgi:hypothetical protein
MELSKSLRFGFQFEFEVPRAPGWDFGCETSLSFVVIDGGQDFFVGGEHGVLIGAGTEVGAVGIDFFADDHAVAAGGDARCGEIGRCEREAAAGVARAESGLALCIALGNERDGCAGEGLVVERHKAFGGDEGRT